MNHPDLLINLLGIAYGAVLIAATFVRSRLTEAMRVDALFMSGHSERTRPVNLLAGLLVAGYATYSLLTLHS
jgi:Cu/Ag efflux pump CusA